MSRTKKKDFPRRDDKGRIKENCYCFTLYEDSKSYDYSVNKLWIQANAIKWLFARHDKDEGKKPHVHVVTYFKNTRLLQGIAERLCIPEASIHALNVELGDDVAMIKYDAHITEAAKKKKKHEYDWREFESNFELEHIFVDKERRQFERRELIIKFINSVDSEISYNTLLAWAQKNDCFSELLRGGWLFQGLLNEHNRKYKIEESFENAKNKAYLRDPARKYGFTHYRDDEW